MRMRSFIAMGSLAALSGCAVGPNHGTPEVATPQAYRWDAKPAETSGADQPWSHVFAEPKLAALIKAATENGFDVLIAQTRVEAARQYYRRAIWATAPTIGVTAGGGKYHGQPTLPTFYPPLEPPGTLGAFADLSWELDVWGRLRRIAEDAKEQANALEEDRHGVYISLIGGVAEFYYSLAGLDRQRVYLEEAIKTRQATLELFTSRAQGGVGNDLEVARAEANVRDAEARMADVQQAIATTEHALSFLVAKPPGAIDRAALDKLPAPVDVPAGLPSALLTRRPDVRAADRRVAAANARIGAEQGDYFPKLALTAFGGVLSQDLEEASGIYGVQGLITWTLPFLGGEGIRAEVKAAKAQWKGATLAYERAATNAFREVSDALILITTLKTRVEKQEQVVAALDRAEQLAMSRYQGGVANYLDVLTTQEQQLLNQLVLADTKGQLYGASARLYRALGGGWGPPKDEQN